VYAGETKSDRKPVTIRELSAMKGRGEKIAVSTAYDASFAHAMDVAAMDAVLVGDSLGMVLQGHDSTLPVSVDDIVYHCACVARGLHAPMLIADMPFMSFATEERALDAAERLMAEGGARMVKLEGGGPVIDITARLMGGFRVQGKTDRAAEQLLADAQELEAAGASLLVLECIPDSLAARVSQSLTIPTIGIGAGPDCDGQVLVLYDLLGVTPGRRPRFSRDFLAGTGSVGEALAAYVAAVKQGTFPGAEESFGN
jgi:3-methyl-2-oxobutanoate hydroxymethyltransferase